MSTTEKGQYRPYAHARGVTVASYVFTGVNGASPTVTEDPGKVVSTVERTAEGIYLITLKRRYAMIHAIAGTSGGADDDAQVTAVVDGGGAANTIEVTGQTGAGTNDDLDGKLITVMILAYDSTS